MSSADHAFDGRVVVVTGAGRNIGAAIALGFADAGADLLLIARTAGPVEQVAANIREATGRRVEVVTADVADSRAVDAIAERATQAFGSVDVLVNNAYDVGAVAPVLEIPDGAWERALAVNLLAPLRLCRAFAATLGANGDGSVVNVLSGSGFLPSPGLAAYGVAKAALWMLTRSLATELAPRIRVNAVCPGLVSETGEPRSESHHRLLPQVPMGRVGRPEEIVGAALYLAAATSTYTTGTVIVANGGRPW